MNVNSDNATARESYAVLLSTGLAAIKAGQTAGHAFGANAVRTAVLLDIEKMSLAAVLRDWKAALSAVPAADRKILADAGLAYTAKSSVSTHALLGAFILVQTSDVLDDSPKATQEMLRKITLNLTPERAREIVRESADRKAALKALRTADKIAKEIKEAAAKEEATRKIAAQEEAEEATQEEAEEAEEATPVASEDTAPAAPGVTDHAPEDMPKVRGERVEDLLVKVVGIVNDGDPIVITDLSRKIVEALAAMVAQMPASV